jgi:G3E family GTPase
MAGARQERKNAMSDIISYSGSKQLPICILTGFLGSGKTTLLNKLLKSEQARRMGVLVNDFGEIDIDSQIIESIADDTVSLRNGCICCSMRGDFIEAILKLLRRENPPERLIVETSGVSDPSSIIHTLTHPELARLLRVDAVVTVVDASEFLVLGLAERRLAEAQIGSADMVVVNKASLVDEKSLVEVDRKVREIVPQARLLHTNFGDVPWSLLFDEEQVSTKPALAPSQLHGSRLDGSGPLERMASDRKAFSLTLFRRQKPPEPRQHCGDHSCGCPDHEHHAHHEAEPSLTEAFESASVIIERPLAMDKLHDALRTLPRDIFRLKGLFHVDINCEKQVLIQVVGDRVSAVAARSWGERPRRSEVVAIGLKGRVSKDELRRLFEACTLANDPIRSDGLVAWFSSWFRTRPSADGAS